MEWEKNKYLDIIQNTQTIKQIGRITEIIGLTIESDGPKSSIGDLCYIYNEFDEKPTMAEVVGFKSDKILLMPLASPDGIRPGAFVVNSGGAMKIGVGNQLIGRVLDGLGNPIDNLGEIQFSEYRSTRADAINPLKRSSSFWKPERPVSLVYPVVLVQRIKPTRPVTLAPLARPLTSSPASGSANCASSVRRWSGWKKKSPTWRLRLPTRRRCWLRERRRMRRFMPNTSS